MRREWRVEGSHANGHGATLTDLWMCSNAQARRETKNKLSRGCLLSPAYQYCGDYTNTSTGARISIYLAAMIYHAILHRTNCDKNRSFQFRVIFSRYIRKMCVSQYRVTSERDLKVTPSLRRSSPHLSHYLSSLRGKCYSGVLLRA